MDPSPLSAPLGTAQTALLTAAAVLLIAPLAFSIPARSTLSAVVSFTLIAAALLAVITGKTVIHEVLAAVIYLAMLLSASTIYDDGSRIERAIQERAAGPFGLDSYSN